MSAVDATLAAHPDADAHARVDARELSRLKWRCRRGLLENDLLIERFFAAYEEGLTRAQARGLQALMDLGDNDLLDLLLGRTQPADDLASPEVCGVLALLRPPRVRNAADTSESPSVTMPNPAPRNSDDTL